MFGWSRLARIWLSRRKRNGSPGMRKAKGGDLDGYFFVVLVVGATAR